MIRLSRRTFLEGSAAAACGALLLGGCQGGGSIDGSVTAMSGSALVPFAMFPKLMTAGDGVVVDVDGTLLAVIRTGDSTATALSAVCTHQGCTVEVSAGSAPIVCPCHGSTFSIDGVVIHGPARSALRKYAASVGSDGVTVTVG